jgi:hypothetical protein
MSHENLEAAREVIAAVNDRDLDRYLAHCTERIQLETLPDFHLVIERLEPVGSDRVLAFLSSQRDRPSERYHRRTGVLSAASGDIPSANVYDFAGGKITRIRVFLDRQEALEAVGLRE